MLSALENESNKTFTENGALTNRSAGSDCLNFFAVCGALRRADDATRLRLFIRAYAENRNLALRTLFYVRDIRGGLGERDLFRQILTWLARNRPAAVIKNLALVPEYGRWDDVLCLLDTPCERQAAALIRRQLAQDITALQAQRSPSLLAKWLPSVNTASPETRALAKRVCRGLRMTEKTYRKTLAALRRRLDVLERRLCRRDYTFDYAAQPSGAMFKYHKAFMYNDGKRYRDFLTAVQAGEQTLHADALYPYEIVQAYLHARLEVPAPNRNSQAPEPDMARTLDATWNSLPDYTDCRNALAVIDGSGSMYWGTPPWPASIALSLGMYFAERNQGFFRNHFITFSHTPRLVRIQGDSIADRIDYCMSFNECANTNLRAVFELILATALRHDLPQEELPETLYIISDMEFDMGVEQDETLFEEIRAMYTRYGYRLPALVYWNVRCRHVQFPVRKDDRGAVMVSGASPTVFRMAVAQSMTPETYMLSVLNSDRYAPVCA